MASCCSLFEQEYRCSHTVTQNFVESYNCDKVGSEGAGVELAVAGKTEDIVAGVDSYHS